MCFFNEAFVIGFIFGFPSIVGMYFMMRSRLDDDCELESKSDRKGYEEEIFFDDEIASEHLCGMNNLSGCCFDSFNKTIEHNIHITGKKLMDLEELNNLMVAKKVSKELQLYPREQICSSNLVLNNNKTSNRILLRVPESLRQKVDGKQSDNDVRADRDGELRDVKEHIKTQRTDNATVNSLGTHSLMEAKRNGEKIIGKCDRLCTRIGILEKQVTESSAHIIGMDTSFRSPMSVDQIFGYGDSVAARSTENRCFFDPAGKTAVSGPPTSP